MHFTLSSVASAFAFSSFILSVHARVAYVQLEERQQICSEDDYLLGLQDFPADSTPFCSSYLGIPLNTITVATFTPRTTVYASTTTTVGTSTDVVTTYDATATVTVTETDSVALVKRQDTTSAATLPSAVAQLAPSAVNFSSSVSSACSCLHIVPAAIYTTATLSTTSTRTEAVIEYDEGTTSITTDGGTETVTVISTTFISVANISGTSSITTSTSSSNLTSSVTSSSTSSAPTTTGSPSSDGCPGIDGTTIQDPDNPCKVYNIQCYIDYLMTNYDLEFREPTFRDCIDRCTEANDGALTPCSGVSFTPNDSGVNCYVHKIIGNQTIYPPYDVVSAVLSNSTASNCTNSSSSSSSIITSTTSSSNLSTSTTSTPSMSPSPSANLTTSSESHHTRSSPSSSPTNSYNMTTTSSSTCPACTLGNYTMTVFSVSIETITSTMYEHKGHRSYDATTDDGSHPTTTSTDDGSTMTDVMARRRWWQ